MSSPPTFDQHRDAVLEHLDRLFALAQILTPNTDEAVELVEAVYRRAFRSERRFDSAEAMRHWLFALLIEARRTRPPVPSLHGSTGEEHAPLADLRGRLAEEVVDEALPAAFTALTPEQRLLLVLCDPERMTWAEAGRMLDLDPVAASSRLEEARLALDRAVYANVTEIQRRLIESSLGSGWRPAALQRMMESHLISLPPTLKPEIEALAREHEVVERRHDRVPGPDEEKRRSLSAVQRLGAALILIMVAGLVGYAFSGMSEREPERNLIRLSARQAGSADPAFQTASPEQAERYILDRFGQRLIVPTISFAALEGVSIREIANGVEVPAILYRDVSGGPAIIVYVYSYVFLDRYEDHLEIERDILRQIEHEGHFDLHDLGEEKALVWRHDDDIFIAITTGDADDLRRRIALPA